LGGGGWQLSTQNAPLCRRALVHLQQEGNCWAGVAGGSLCQRREQKYATSLADKGHRQPPATPLLRVSYLREGQRGDLGRGNRQSSPTPPATPSSQTSYVREGQRGDLERGNKLMRRPAHHLAYLAFVPPGTLPDKGAIHPDHHCWPRRPQTAVADACRAREALFCLVISSATPPHRKARTQSAWVSLGRQANLKFFGGAGALVVWAKIW
jgi:hypothetical protein